jgi:D-glycero-alpha-D-manno-heptose-7-phosphate kinase
VLGTAIDLYVEWRDGRMNHPVPLGTGLGSSSAAHVVRQLRRAPGLRPWEAAWRAWEAERAEGSAVGWQDAAFAAHGGFRLMEFRETETIVHQVETPRLAELQSHLLLVYTGSRRTSDVARESLGRVRDNGRVLRLARRMADEGHRMLTGTVSMASFGSLLHGAWLAKRSTCPGVSSPAIDAAYERAIAAGAWGGKLLGAGGGGYLLFVVAPERRASVIAATGLAELPFRIAAAV